MRRQRIRRRRAFALALVPAAMIPMGWGQASPAAEDRRATVDAPASVRIGDATHIKGEFPDSSNAEVAILNRSAGENGYKRVGTAHTGAGGRWSARVKPRRTGDWRARLVSPAATNPLADGPTPDAESGTEVIRVRSLTKVAPAKRDVVAGKETEIRGRVLPAGQRDVTVQIGGQTKHAHADKKGRFQVDWKAPGAGDYKVRATAKRNKDASGSKDSGGHVTAYRYAQASWYGPGLYGNRTACGQTLSPSTRGVANKSLPCGTKLTIRYGSKEVHVQVIDRGPYVGDREFDLTEATRNDLGFGSTGQILVNK
jgi:rare lipoprotein A (peptidoglycan hydrolase)